MSARPAIALLTVASLGLQSGCATPVPAAAPQEAVGRFAIVASATEPEIRLEGFARGKAEGALSGAGTGFLACAAGLGHGACAGPYCGAVVVVWLAICGGAAAVGAVAGAAVSRDAQTVRSAESALSTVIAPSTIQEALRGELAAAVRAAPFAASRLVEPQGAESVVEVGLVRVATQGSGLDSPLVLSMQARVRVLRAADQAELHRLDLTYDGPALKLTQWAAQGGEPLAQALAHGYRRLAAELYDQLFLVYPFPDRGHQGAGALSVAFGLAPAYPLMRGTVTSEASLPRRIEWLAVDSVRPELRWQAFPRELDLAAAPADMARVRHVTYDLVIAREHNLAPAEEVYRREGLERPVHRLEVDLQSDAYYYWSVRARFELDGRQRVTEWGATHWAALGRLAAPSRWSYRFRTP